MNETQPERQREFVKATRPRIRHTMLRVRDLEKSLDFYTRLFGMTLYARRHNEGGKYPPPLPGYFPRLGVAACTRPCSR